MMLERSRKRAAELDRPTEHDWALSQPVKWRDACMIFAMASNTRGGVVGWSMQAMLANAGNPMSLRTFTRQVASLQEHGIVYQDEKRSLYSDTTDLYSQAPSTWFLFLDRVMPRGVRLTGKYRAPSFPQRIARYCDEHQASRWVDSPADSLPFL